MTIPNNTTRFFRIRYEKLGGHYHCRIFVANHPAQTFAGVGKLVMDEADFTAMRDQWQTAEFLKREPTP